jgi:hypothetical protein
MIISFAVETGTGTSKEGTYWQTDPTQLDQQNGFCKTASIEQILPHLHWQQQPRSCICGRKGDVPSPIRKTQKQLPPQLGAYTQHGNHRHLVPLALLLVLAAPWSSTQELNTD